MFFSESEKQLFKTMSFPRKLRFLLGTMKRSINALFLNRIKVIRNTENHINPIKLHHIVRRITNKTQRHIYWPVHPTSTVVNPKNIHIGVDTSPGYAQGCYIQGLGKIYIGDYTGIAPNVGIISSNHSILDFRKHEHGVVKIGKYCWLGMGCVILPNVELGDFTIVRAGAVVTKSFKEGYCVIGGNPAKIVQQFPKEAWHLFTRYEHEHKYNGYIPSEDFGAYRKKYLNV